MRPADELYVGAWGRYGDRAGFIVDLDGPFARDAYTGEVFLAPGFERLPTDPNTPREVRKGAQGSLAGIDGTVLGVHDDGTVDFRSKTGHEITGRYDRFRPLYASNH